MLISEVTCLLWDMWDRSILETLNIWVGSIFWASGASDYLFLCSEYRHQDAASLHAREWVEDSQCSSLSLGSLVLTKLSVPHFMWSLQLPQSPLSTRYLTLPCFPTVTLSWLGHNTSQLLCVCHFLCYYLSDFALCVPMCAWCLRRAYVSVCMGVMLCPALCVSTFLLPCDSLTEPGARLVASPLPYLGFLWLWRDIMIMTTLIRKTFNWGWLTVSEV